MRTTVKAAMVVLLIHAGLATRAFGISQFPIFVDGAFTNSDEWSDVVPIAFISPSDPDGTLVPTTLDNPLANAFTYVDLAVGVSVSITNDVFEPVELYLMYDYTWPAPTRYSH